MNLDDTMNKRKDKAAIERLKTGIITIAAELSMDTELAKFCVEEKSKEELINLFCDLKELRLKNENLRLIGLLVD